MPILTLHGCSPEPLGNYLKALGVFRLVAEQADPAARAWWEAGVLRLTTRFDETALQSFFLGQNPSDLGFAPSPIFAPWGGRPGFYELGSNGGAKERLERLVSSESDRKQLGPAISVLRKLRDLLSTHQTWNGKAKKAEFPWRSADKGKKDKNLLMATCRNTMPGAFIDWMDACLALEDDASFGILFGTGGNEGSADITNNFWLFIEHCIGFPKAHEDSGQWLASSLFSKARLSGLKETSGQLFPSSAKGENIGQGFTGATATNPWDVVLAMEGSMLFAGAMTKRLSQHGRGKAAFPFMLDHVGTGQPSESGRDEPLMEEMRPLVAESTVLSCINNHVVTEKDFVRAGQAVNLTAPGRKRFFQMYEQRMSSLITHPLFDYKVSYRRALELQARLLAKTLTGEIAEYIPLLTR